MIATRKIITCSLFLLLALIPSSITSLAQSWQLDPQKWVDELSTKNNNAIQSFKKLDSILLVTDSTITFQFLDEMTGKAKSGGYHLLARLNCLKADQIYFRCVSDNHLKPGISFQKEQVKSLLNEAIQQAYRSEDDYLIAFVSLQHSSLSSQFSDMGPAVMYAMNCIDLYEKLKYPIAPGHYQLLAELLYKVREYKDCIKYAQKAVRAWQTDPHEFIPYTISCINTVALGYHRQQLYDSAFFYYDRALQLAKKHNQAWVGIVSGNMGQIYYALQQYDTAYALLKKDYLISKEEKLYDNAANSLQWVARTDLALGNTATALAETREAFSLLKLWPDAVYLKNTYYTITQVFRQLKNYDSAFYYNNLYAALNDSLEKVVSTSSMEISKSRLNDETSRFQIQKLNREKRSQLQFRNLILVLIVLASIIALLYVNRLRVRHIYKEQLVLQEKHAAEALAREQLQLVTQNLIEKTGLAEELQRQLNNRTVSVERQELATTISNLTILTEADWEKFKSLFEELYPGFFLNLQEKVSDITVAELRMAALTRLKLPTNHIASILGISANSVYKTKQRLRQRLHLEGENSIEEFIAGI